MKGGLKRSSIMVCKAEAYKGQCGSLHYVYLHESQLPKIIFNNAGVVFRRLFNYQ